MTALERIVCERADEQMAGLVGSVATRVYCACGCGVWWYQEKGGIGRPRALFSDACRARRHLQLQGKIRRSRGVKSRNLR